MVTQFRALADPGGGGHIRQIPTVSEIEKKKKRFSRIKLKLNIFYWIKFLLNCRTTHKEAKSVEFFIFREPFWWVYSTQRPTPPFWIRQWFEHNHILNITISDSRLLSNQILACWWKDNSARAGVYAPFNKYRTQNRTGGGGLDWNQWSNLLDGTDRDSS